MCKNHSSSPKPSSCARTTPRLSSITGPTTKSEMPTYGEGGVSWDGIKASHCCPCMFWTCWKYGNSVATLSQHDHTTLHNMFFWSSNRYTCEHFTTLSEHLWLWAFSCKCQHRCGRGVWYHTCNSCLIGEEDLCLHHLWVFPPFHWSNIDQSQNGLDQVRAVSGFHIPSALFLWKDGQFLFLLYYQ